MTSGSSDWRQGTSYALGASNAINLYFNNEQEWLLSPTFDLSTGGPYQLEINVAVTNWNNGTQDDTMGSDDEVQLLQSTDGGATWLNVTTWNASNEPPVGGVEYVEDLTALTGNVQFAIYATDGTVDDAEDYDFHVGKFRVREIPSCIEPSGLMISNITPSSADFAWTENGTATVWNIEVVDVTAGETVTGTATATGVTNPYTVSGLNANNDYEFYVQADCGGSTSTWVGPFTFTTPVLVDCTAGTPVNTTFCYDSNEDLRYVFTSTDGSALRVDFIEGYFEDCCDDITIYDGGEITDAVLFASDTNFNNDATGISAISTGDTVMVRMVSDSSVSCAAGSGSGIPLNFDVSCNTCTSSTSTAAVIDDCTTSSGFNVVIDITDMGSATDLTLSDDQGSATQSATSIGMFTFGPYASGTVVEIAVANDADALCTETFSDLTFNCPPVNNDCSGAITLTPGAVFTDNPIMGSNAGATGSGETPLPSCSSYDPADATGFGGDVWYSVVVPADGNLTIEVDNNGGPSTDSGMQVYSGTCGSLVAVACDDDGGNGAFSQVVIETADGLAGETLLVRVFEYGGNSEMNFLISAFSATLSTTDLENEAAFTYFPNPVKNTLTLNAQNTIENVVMYNMLGQQVLRVMPNTVDSELDMSNLQTGTYFVKVTIANVTKTIRVIKQ